MVGKEANSDPVLTRIVEQDRVPWYRKPNLMFLYFMLFPTCMGIETTSGFDSQMINALQGLPYWSQYFGNPQSSLKGIINSAYSLGAILSLPFVPWLNDRFGRRWSIFIGSTIMVGGAIIQGFSQDVGMYIFARLMLGFGIPSCIVAGSSLIGELGYPKERPVLTSLFNVSYFIGSIVAAGICFGTNNIQGDWSWRIPSLLQMVPSLIQMSFVFFIPESPRWLVSKDRVEEANNILVKYHAEGDADSEFVKAELAQIRAVIQLEREAAQKSWFDLIATPGMRMRVYLSTFLGLATQWSGNTLISYYLSDLLKMIGYNDSVFFQKINVSISCWNMVCAFIISLLVLRFRRRPMYLVSTVSLLLCYIAWTISMQQAQTAKDAGHPNLSANIAVIFFIYAYAPCYNIGYNALTYTYLIELWPYMERSRGLAYFQFWGRGAAFFTTFVNPIGTANVGWRYLISYCAFLAFEVVFVYFLFPETFGRTLEELAFIFEDRQLAEEATVAVEKAVGHHVEDVHVSAPAAGEKERRDDVV